MNVVTCGEDGTLHSTAEKGMQKGDAGVREVGRALQDFMLRMLA